MMSETVTVNRKTLLEVLEEVVRRTVLPTAPLSEYVLKQRANILLTDIKHPLTPRKRYLEIIGDSNDADYITQRTAITDEQLALILPLIEAIKEFKPYKVPTDWGGTWNHDHNWPNSEYSPREDLGEKGTEELYLDKVGEEAFYTFKDEFAPSGIHTIVSITLLDVAEETTLLKYRW